MDTKRSDRARVLAKEEFTLRKFEGEVWTNDEGETVLGEGAYLAGKTTVKYDHETKEASLKIETFDKDGDLVDVHEESGPMILEGE